jgi:hypothetical protein
MASGTRRLLAAPGAAGVIENVLAGTPLQYPGIASTVEIYGTVIAAGAGEVTMDVIFGTDTVAEGIILPIEIAAGEGPRVPDHRLCIDACASADQVQIRLRNAGAAARNCILQVVVQPV